VIFNFDASKKSQDQARIMPSAASVQPELREATVEYREYSVKKTGVNSQNDV
jgi:hypothetical protein